MSTASASDSPQSTVRYAEQLAKSSRRVSSTVESPAVFLPPLIEASVSTTHTFRSYSCGGPSMMFSPHKVIIVVGATGTGKSALINTMANYIFGVKWEDNFRFKLVHERRGVCGSQAHTQTQNITSYTIHSNDHINVPFTLTIIDTPGFGDTRGIEHDKAIVDKIQEFFSHPEAHGVDHIDAVGFVVQSSQSRLTASQRYIFDSILAVFGKDIKPNILLLITWCDGSPPEVLDAVQEAKLPFGKTFMFNNSALFASQGEGGMSFDAMFWQMGYTSMKEFFDALDGLQPQSLMLTVNVLQERKCLQIVLKGVQPQILFACAQADQLRKEKKLLEDHHKEKEAHIKSFEYEPNVAKFEKIRDLENSSMNCPKCLYSCHYPCTSSQSKPFCHAMSLGNCTVCPGKCSSSDHVHENFRYSWKMMREKHTYADIEIRYRDAQGQIQTSEEVIKQVEANLAKSEAAVSELIEESHRCTQRLEQIALKPNPIGVIEYIDLLIETEKAMRNPGWEKRVGSLMATKQREKTKDAAASDNAFGNIWSTVTKAFRKI